MVDLNVFYLKDTVIARSILISLENEDKSVQMDSDHLYIYCVLGRVQIYDEGKEMGLDADDMAQIENNSRKVLRLVSDKAVCIIIGLGLIKTN